MNEKVVNSAAVQERQAFEHLLEQALTPLIPIAIGYGISARDVSMAISRVYLRVIEARLQHERGHEISDARLALASRLTRSEVTQIRREGANKSTSDSDSAAQLNRIAIVLSTWHTNPKFSGAYGLPLDLDLERTPEKSHHSFEELIEIACAEMAEAVTIDELVANGFVDILPGRIVRCRARTATASAAAGKVGLLEQYGRFLGAAAGTVAHNITSSEAEGYFDRLLVSDVPLSSGVRTRFYSRAKASGEAFLTELDSWLSTNESEPVEGVDTRYGIGLFFFEERS